MGTYCQLCAAPDQFYVGATDDIDAHCEPCEEARRAFFATAFTVLGVLAGVLLALFAVCRLNSRARRAAQRAYEFASSKFHVKNQLKYDSLLSSPLPQSLPCCT